MKGKSAFRISEIEAIKLLIKEKLRATPEKQKGIRQKIRNIEFFYSDFDNKKDGYTVEDFESLIRLGKITIIDGGHPDTNVTDQYSFNNLELETKNVAKATSSRDFHSIEDSLKKNCFNPQTDNETIIPNQPGNYILCLRKNSKLPKVAVNPTLKEFDGLEVVYTGIASRSLRRRDYRQHFKENNAGRSTLRKSLGVLLGYTQIPRDKDGSWDKTKFSQNDEQELSNWMCDNLIMFFLPIANFAEVELELINHFNPPLNLADNNNSVNSDFRNHLSSLRKQKGLTL